MNGIEGTVLAALGRAVRALIIWAALTAVCTISLAAGTSLVTVPIAIHGRYVYVPVSVDGKVATFILDSGAGANVVTPQAVKRLELKPGKAIAKVQGAGGQAGMAGFVPIDKLDVGPVALTHQTAVVIPLPDVLRCDGLLGAPFLQRWVVTIDYEHARLTVSSPDSFSAPSGAPAYPLRFGNNTPQMEAVADGHRGWFTLDTGADDTVTLFSPFVDSNNLRGKYTPTIRTVTGRGVGGLLYGDAVRLPEFQIGSFRLENPVATLSRQTTGVFADTRIAGNIGGEFLRRFTITFDYPHKQVFFIPNASVSKPFVYNRTGLAIDYEKGQLIVRDVVSDSPGSEAGVKANDVIFAIGDRPTAQMQPWDTTELLEQKPGTKLRLQILSPTGSTREVTLTLRDML